MWLLYVGSVANTPWVYATAENAQQARDTVLATSPGTPTWIDKEA